MGATASSIRRFHLAVRAIKDLQCIPPAVTTLHKQIAAGGASAGLQPYLPPPGLVILVDNASKSRHGPLLGALETLAWVCFLRVGDVTTIRVVDIGLPGLLSFEIAKLAKRGTPPDLCPGTGTKYVSGPTPSRWDMTRYLTC